MLAIPICYIQEPQERSPITLLLENINFVSSLERNLAVCAVSILLKQDIISFMSIENLMSIEIQEEIR